MNFQNFKVYGALTLVSLLYGINYSILKIVVPEFIRPYGLTVYRVAVSAAVFWIFYFFKQEKINWKADGWRFFLSALCGASLNMLLFYKGISMTTAINGSIIMTLTPVLVLLWAALLIKERITKVKIMGIFLGLIGALIIFYQPTNLISFGNWQGDFLVILNGIVYACYLVIIKPLMQKYKPLTVATWIFSFAVFMVLPAGFQEAAMVDLTQLPLKVILSMFYSIILVTVVVYFLNIWTLVRVDPSVVGAFIYLQPVFSTITAMLFFGETLEIKHLVAAIFIFLGVWLVTKKPA